jgi:hypothetical protein
MLLGIILRIAAIILAVIGFYYLMQASDYGGKKDSQAAYLKQVKSTVCFILETLLLWVTLLTKV